MSKVRGTLRALGTSAPIYVTNAKADGTIAHYETPIGVSLLLLLLAMVNALAWGGIGIWKAAEVIA